MKKRDLLYVAVIVALAALLGASGRRCAPNLETRVDTLVVRDTIRDTVLVTVARQIVRTDTVWLRAVADTVFVEVEVPVEQKIYQTADYRAVVEGFRPRLTEIEIFRNTTYIKENTLVTPRSRPTRFRWGVGVEARWSIGVQAGWGINLGGDRLSRGPYIGLGVQYNLITF
jgi:hypothetical protein